MGSPTLRIRLFGELDLRHDGAALPLESGRAASLLAYLLLHRQVPQARQHLAFLLWPDSSEAQAQTNLRKVLHTLRRALPEPDRFLDVTARALQWRSDAPCWLDVAAFEQALAQAETEPPDGELPALREAVELYAGDLLEGCYDEWLFTERERLRQRYLAALERLTSLHEARGEYAQAIQVAERLIRLDPLHEETYRQLMRLYDARGDRARALRVYHVCAVTLERELGVEPSAPTRATYEALLPLEAESGAEDIDTGRLGGPPFIGRTAERARLADLWRATVRGKSQFVLVTGEPGVGKTRLIEEFRSWCARRGALTSEARSYAAEGALAYGPVVTWLRSEAIRPRLARLNRAYMSELSRLLPELHAEVTGLVRPEPLPDTDERQRLFDASAQALLAAGAPLLLVADDLHWFDRETLQFLHYLIRVAPDAPLLVAASARREEIDDRHPLSDLVTGLHALERLTEIQLGRLTHEETTVLAERLGGHPLTNPDADRLYAETEGNPLFVVETLRAGWRSGIAGDGRISPKVQAVIRSRLAQLSASTQALVEVAATIGREFTTDVLGAASEAADHMLAQGLDELWRRHIIREHGVDGYDFSHDKIREVAYLAISPALRRHHHLRVAQALERLHASDPGPVSGQLAAHYERAGRASEAVVWYHRAAQAAQNLYATPEAVRLLDRALDVLGALPETPERTERELALLTALPAPLLGMEGYASRRLSDVHRRARELERQLGIDSAPPLLRSLATASLANGDFVTARSVGRQLLVRGERDGNDMLLVEAAYVLGIAAFWGGEFEAARKHFESAVERYRHEQRRAHLLWYGQDPKVICLGRLANTLWFLGRPDAASRARDAACALADEIGHPFSRSAAHVFAALLALDMRDQRRLREHATALMLLESGRTTWLIQMNCEVLNGYLDVLDGRHEAGIARIQRALDASRGSAPTPGFHAMLVRVLLEACAAAGDARAGLEVADRALGMSGIRVWEAEVRRLRAEFLAALGQSTSDVEAEFRCALQVAQGQGATILELRVAASLLHHHLERGDVRSIHQVRDHLALLVKRFPEAGNIPDLGEAAALLARC